MTEQRSPSAVRWAVPGLAVLIGVAYLIAGLAGGDTFFAVGGFVLMAGIAVTAIVLTRYSETAKGLLDRRDERINSLDRDATLVAGGVLIACVLGMFVIEIARGQDGSPYYQLGAIAGVAYLVALVWLRIRR